MRNSAYKYATVSTIRDAMRRVRQWAFVTDVGQGHDGVGLHVRYGVWWALPIMDGDVVHRHLRPTSPWAWANDAALAPPPPELVKHLDFWSDQTWAVGHTSKTFYNDRYLK